MGSRCSWLIILRLDSAAADCPLTVCSQHNPNTTRTQSEELQALEDQNAHELMSLQTAADSARARASAAESAAAASAAKVSSLTQELAAAEAALTAARQEGEAALAAVQQQHEGELQQEQQKRRELKAALQRQEEEWAHKVAALEVGRVCVWLTAG